MRHWDVFISHASEDTPTVATPLADALRRAGLRVWLDRQELRVGDSLREKIDEGLSDSWFGVVVLSPSFLAKGWPRRELDGLFVVEETEGRTVILPVWHQIDKATLATYSPILADRLAADTVEGIAAAAAQLIDAVTDPENGLPADVSPTALRLLLRVLDGTPNREDMVGFFASHPRLIHAALPSDPHSERWSTEIGGVTVDLCISDDQPSAGYAMWSAVQLQPPAEPLFKGARLAPSLAARVAELKRIGQWVKDHHDEAQEALPGVEGAPGLIVVSGRRSWLSDADQDRLRRYAHSQRGPGVTIHTYDWIVDAAAQRASDRL